MNQRYPILLVKILAAPFLATLLACGGGGGGGGAVVVAPGPISGVVAAGAPVSGIVFVKGANGVATSAVIQPSGHFSIDVSALTPNYLLYAEGLSGDKLWRIYSVATGTGTTNVTPLTDLVVANALGALPGTAADSASLFNTWNGSQIAPAAVATAKARVQASLAPLFTGLGVSSDPLTGSFSADHTGMDLVLDSLDVTYLGSVATVTNRLTGHACTDDVSDHGATATPLPSGDAGVTQAAAADLVGISAITQAGQALHTGGYTGQADAEARFGPFFAADFFHGGMTKSQYLDSMFSGGASAGVPGFTSAPMIVAPIPANALNGTPYLRGYYLNILNSYNYGGSATVSYTSAVTADGTHWLLYGDRRWVGIRIQSSEVKLFNADGSTVMQTGLDLEVENAGRYASAQGVQSAIVTGLGLPAGGVVLTLGPGEGWYYIQALGSSFYPLTDDAVIAAIPDNTTYDVRLYSQPAGSVSLQDTPVQSYPGIVMAGSAPLPNSALAASWFPTLVAPSSHALSAANIPGPFTVTWSNPASGLAPAISIALDWQNVGDPAAYEVVGLPTSYGLGSQSLTLPATTGTPANAHLRVVGFDAYGRGYGSIWAFQ